ncbi:unnamed protein product, partial [Symbiodinium pilosum]
MGQTEDALEAQHGTWWRSCPHKGEVIIRKQVLLTSNEITRVPFGQLVLQAGPLKVFKGGLVRMPLQPRGWVTIDATAIGGPLYLQKVAPLPHAPTGEGRGPKAPPKAPPKTAFEAPPTKAQFQVPETDRRRPGQHFHEGLGAQGAGSGNAGSTEGPCNRRLSPVSPPRFCSWRGAAAS